MDSIIIPTNYHNINNEDKVFCDTAGDGIDGVRFGYYYSKPFEKRRACVVREVWKTMIEIRWKPVKIITITAPPHESLPPGGAPRPCRDTPRLPKMISIASEWCRRRLRTSGRAVVAFYRRPSRGRRDDGRALANSLNRPITAKQEIIVQTNTFLSFPEGQFAWSRANKIIAVADASNLKRHLEKYR